jgi:aspartate/methionine/tyrosine aminotransferase
MDQLAAAVGPKTKAIFIGSPSNPTGWTATPQEQRVLLAFARERGLAIISDEVYGVLAFGMKRAPSFLDIAEDEDNVFVINSFSKAWAMTGWRIGWLVAPKRLSGAMAQLGVNLNTGTTVFAQAGAVAALKDGDGFIAEMQARCLKGREIVGEFIAAQNRLSWVKPDGAFYAYVEVDGLTDSVAFASTLLQTAKVGVAPGAAFASGPGDTRDESYLRLCFAPSPARLTAALERIAAALR